MTFYEIPWRQIKLARARLLKNKRQHMQRLLKMSWHDGVLVIAIGLHRARFNEEQWLMLDTHQVHILGLFSDESLADQYIRNVGSSALGMWPRDYVSTSNEDWMRIMSCIADQVTAKVVQPISMRDRVPRSSWNVWKVPCKEYCAVRSVLTMTGCQWEFYPNPPQTIKDLHRLKIDLQRHQLLDPELDWISIFDIPLAPATIEMQTVWQAQAAQVSHREG
jgi:hypothetical protein